MADPERHQLAGLDGAKKLVTPSMVQEWRELKKFCQSLFAPIQLIETRSDDSATAVISAAGVPAGKKYISGRFEKRFHKEEACFEKWFRSQNYEPLFLDRPFLFQGARDLLEVQANLYLGVRSRRDQEVCDELQSLLGSPITPLEIVHPKIKHLDFCLSDLGNGSVLCFQEALEPFSRGILQDQISSLIPVSEKEALCGACGAMAIQKKVILPAGCSQMAERLQKNGFESHFIDFASWADLGIGPRSLVLRTDIFQAPTKPGRFDDSSRHI